MLGGGGGIGCLEEEVELDLRLGAGGANDDDVAVLELIVEHIGGGHAGGAGRALLGDDAALIVSDCDDRLVAEGDGGLPTQAIHQCRHARGTVIAVHDQLDVGLGGRGW